MCTLFRLNWAKQTPGIMRRNSDTNKDFVLNDISAIDNVNHLFNVSDIRDVINNMERGKACDLDGIFAEHLLYAGDRLPVLLTLLFNMCILHGYL